MGRTFRTDVGGQGQKGARATRESPNAMSQHGSQHPAWASCLPGTEGFLPCSTLTVEPRLSRRSVPRARPVRLVRTFTRPMTGRRSLLIGEAPTAPQARRSKLRWPLGAGHRGSLGPHNDHEPPAESRTLLAGSFQAEGLQAFALLAAGQGVSPPTPTPAAAGGTSHAA